jgi:hypothetical protein
LPCPERGDSAPLSQASFAYDNQLKSITLQAHAEVNNFCMKRRPAPAMRRKLLCRCPTRLAGDRLVSTQTVWCPRQAITARPRRGRNGIESVWPVPPPKQVLVAVGPVSHRHEFPGRNSNASMSASRSAVASRKRRTRITAAGRTAGMGGSSLLAAILMGREQRLLIGSCGGPSPLKPPTAR